jgi:two-component system sensor histidine kinase YesM
MNIFRKMLLLLIGLLTPIFLLFTYTSQVSISVVEDSLRSASANQLQFLAHQIDFAANQLATYTLVLSNDPSTDDFVAIPFLRDRQEQYKVHSNLSTKLKLQLISNNWSDEITVYANTTKEVVSTRSGAVYDSAYLLSSWAPGWTYRPIALDGHAAGFYFYASKPFYQQDAATKANAIVETNFSRTGIQRMLDQFKSGGKGDPFLYHPDHDIIPNQTLDESLASAVTQAIQSQSWNDTASTTVLWEDQQYLVNAVRSVHLGWYVVDVIPLNETVLPITKSQTLFYVCVGLLLLTGVLSASLLYRNVQLPIRKLVVGVQRLKKGHFSARVEGRASNEFSFLFARFNEMAAQIQQLIQHVYAERLRSKEALLKQLQSQINPHFLYNCLGFIINMTHRRNEEAVLAMAYNLSDYYRYTTRVENQLTPLAEEVSLIRSYLHIQNMRMERFDYEVDFPEAMLELEVPRLILQPLVENAIIHGIEPRSSAGRIVIRGAVHGERISILVEGTGDPFTSEQLHRLEQLVCGPLGEESGCGLWNVHQRLKERFGEKAGLVFSSSNLGGLQVIMNWTNTRFDADTGGKAKHA